MPTIYGTAGNDDIEGTDADEDVYGLGGDDSLDGNRGNDRLFGGDGADRLYGDFGHDDLFGEAGDDYLQGGSFGYSRLYGGDGNDRLSGSQYHGDQELYGGAGDDQIGAYFDQRVDGGEGHDSLSLSFFAQSEWFGEDVADGDGRLAAESMNYLVDFSSSDGSGYVNGVLTVVGVEEVSIFLKWPGDHTVRLGDGGMRVTVGGGDDHIFGGSGDDFIDGGGGDDIILSGDGNDTITVYGGNIQVSAGDGTDKIAAYKNVPDVYNIDGGAGRDSLHYTDYIENFIVTKLDGYYQIKHVRTNTIDTIRGIETVYFYGVPLNLDAFLFTAGNDEIVFDDVTRADFDLEYSRGEHLNAQAGHDLVRFPTTSGGYTTHGLVGAVFSAGAGNDTVWGGLLADRINGDADNDTLYGEGENDELSGGDGNDILEGGAGNDYLSGGAGIDAVTYLRSAAGVTVNLTTGFALGTATGTDSLLGLENATGSNHADILIGYIGADTLDGRGGADRLEGSAGADVLLGGSGDDILYDNSDTDGDGSIDTLTGGSGRDTFYVGHEDIVTDLSLEDAGVVVMGADHGRIVVVGTGATREVRAYDAQFITYDKVTLTNIESGRKLVARQDADGARIEMAKGVGATVWDRIASDPGEAQTLLRARMVEHEQLVESYFPAQNAPAFSGLAAPGGEEQRLGPLAAVLLITAITAWAAGDIHDAIKQKAAESGAGYWGTLGSALGFNFGSYGSSRQLAPGYSADPYLRDFADAVDHGSNWQGAPDGALALSTGPGSVSSTGVLLALADRVMDEIAAEMLFRSGKLNADYNAALNGQDQTRGDTSLSEFLYTIFGRTDYSGGGGTDTFLGTILDAVGGSSSGAMASLAAVQPTQTFDGGTGVDEMSYAIEETAVTVDLASGQATGAGIGTDILLNIENVMGGLADDVIRGSAGANVLTGGAGNDVIEGRGGADTLTGGDGYDTLSYAGSNLGVSVSLTDGAVSGGHAQGDIVSGFESAIGSAFADDLRGSDGGDWLVGEAGADRLDGGDGADNLVGGAGNDALIGGVGIDTAAYGFENGAGGVTVNLQAGTATDRFGGTDTLSGVENVTGTGLTDTMFGDGASNQLDGMGGADTLFGGDGIDVLNGGDGADVLVGNAQVFVAQLDALNGGAGDDILYAEAADSLNGGLGRDSLIAVNSFSFNLDMAATLIEYAVLDFGDDFITAAGQSARVDVFASGGNDSVTGSNFDDLIFAGVGDDTVSGGSGADSIVGQEGADILSGGDGDDRIYFDGQDTFVSGGAGYDAGYITIGTGAGAVVNLGAASLEFIQDFAGGADTLLGSTSAVGFSAFAGGGADTADGSDFADILWGEAGDDTLTGNAGNDVIVGGAGLDSLRGGAGNDALHGGAGDGARDTFIFQHAGAANADAVYDFVVGTDRIDLSAFGGNSFANVSISNAGGSSVVFLNGQQVCTVVGVTGLTAGDFVFTAGGAPADPGDGWGGKDAALVQPGLSDAIAPVWVAETQGEGMAGQPIWVHGHQEGWLAVLV